VNASGSCVKALVIVAFLLGLSACGSNSSERSVTSRQNLGSDRNLVLIDAETGKVDRSFPDANDTVVSAIVDKHGGWYVAGRFTHIGDVKSRWLAHLNGDGTLDSAFAPDLPAGTIAVYPITASGNVVYANTGSNIAALDAKTGRRIWAISVVGATGLALGNGVLYVGGISTRIDGAHREAVAALDPSTGKPTPWSVRGWGSFSPTISPIFVADGAVYLGGNFTQIGGVRDSCDVAAVSAKMGHTIWVPKKTGPCGTGSDVENVIVSHGQVLVGRYHGGFLSFDIHTGRVLPWSNEIQGAAFPLAVSGNKVYLGGHPGTLSGSFSGVGRKRVNNLTAVVLPSGVLTSWRPKLGKCVYLYAIAVSGRKVLAAGSFSSPSSCD
jgi:outer membrane protein assembly factor BamB